MKARVRALAFILAIAVSAFGGRARAAIGDITLLGQLLPAGAVEICDLWGYVDPNGIDYAIIGSWHAGFYIINVEDPTNPFLVTSVIGNGNNGFDIKMWGKYLYTCRGSSTAGTSKVYDLTNIASPVPSVGFQGHHTFHVHPDGFLYGAYPALNAYDIRTTPMTPAAIWNKAPFNDGHDTLPVGNRLYDFHGYSDTYIYDITDRMAPVLIGTISDPDIVYNHFGAVTADNNYLYICDELAITPRADLTVWNIQNPAVPFKVGGSYDAGATVHNLCIIGNFGFASHYSAGFRVYNVTNPASPVVLDTYDTSAWTGENYEGCYGVYPYAASGVIYATDFDNGLFLFSVQGFPPVTGVEKGSGPVSARIVGNFPNPFNPSTRVNFEMMHPADATLVVYDAAGRLVKTLASRSFGAGSHEVEWDGVDERGARAASGVYFLRLLSEGRSDTHRMVLLK